MRLLRVDIENVIKLKIEKATLQRVDIQEVTLSGKLKYFAKISVSCLLFAHDECMLFTCMVAQMGALQNN